MLQPALTDLIRREIENIGGSAREQTLSLAVLMERAFIEATRQEQIAFSTLFARISYVGQRFGFPAHTIEKVHQFRLAARKARNGGFVSAETVQMGKEAISLALDALSSAEEINQVSEPLPPAGPALQYEPGFNLRVLALRDIPEQHIMVVAEEENPGREMVLRYNVPSRNENFMPTIRTIRQVFGFPVTLQLLDVEEDESGALVPAGIVVEPDYLMDVSAISDCFGDSGPDPFAFLVKKFIPRETTDPILLGNIANLFLDRLLNEPDAEWQKLFAESFRQYPFVYAPMPDSQVKEIANKSQKHFVNLRAMATGGFARQDIDPAACFLEPSFFSNLYGIQGRLDLFYRNGNQSAIVELKSGKPFKPNSYGIARSHFTQTLLYDLLVRSVFGKRTDPVKYILYSGEDTNLLRFAPTIGPEQMEAVQVRNHLVAIERMLTKVVPGDMTVPVFGKLKSAGKAGFTDRDYGRFDRAYGQLNNTEKKYFNAFCGFIAREQWLARVGEESSDTLNGNASLWRNSMDEKMQQFSMLSHLEILENRADQEEPSIIFKKTPRTSDLSNFRTGDIAVLYPAVSEKDTVLQHQVIRCTIVRLEKDHIEVQLRYRQKNLKTFETRGFWCLEPDMMDFGFVAMYRNLLEWAEAPPQVRSRVMGITAKMPPDNWKTPVGIVQKIVEAPGFFLLWGPPGTGKTSVVLRDLSEWVLNHTEENLLLLAYTNRAVDEICEALESIGPDVRHHYLRIGSRHAASARFGDQLLSVKTANCKSRAELLKVLESHRIFVSTVASFGQQEALLKLKKFHRLVIDEASQILEPQLTGLLTHFEHFTLIGDHRQLPAVTAQRPENTVVNDADLNEMGLTDLRDSYFERLYRLCLCNNWHWAYDQLDKQGRMHDEIMQFPGKWFYDGNLRVFDQQKQQSGLQLPGHEMSDYALGDLLGRRRVVFLPVKPDGRITAVQKTSREEADLCARIVVFFKDWWKAEKRVWHADKTLGIITPWRAQIAQIQSALAEAGIRPGDVTIDTVERYQGGARDVIIVSTCANSEWQLASLVSLSTEGVDRKLNVALTRAREHLIMIGNPEILKKDERYRAFMELYGVDKI